MTTTMNNTTGFQTKDSSSTSNSSSKKSNSSTNSAKDGKNNNKENQKQQTNNGASNEKINASSTTNEAEKYKRFENEGVVFKAKLIGSELVMEPRGDKMCQNSIQRLKAIIKGTNSHKKRIVLKISYDGVKVFDEKTNEILHHHEVSQVSYIASDDTDNRTFGYVCDVPNKTHQFICFKTSGPAINVVSVISALFEAVLEKKNIAERERKKQLEESQTTVKQETSSSIDLIGDSEVIRGDLGSSINFEDTRSHEKQHHEKSSFMSQFEPPSTHTASSNIFDHTIASPGNSFSNNTNKNKQSTSTDLIFDDLFSGLNDPIIVDKNDSLISYVSNNNPQQPTGSNSQLSSGGSIPLVVSSAGGSNLALSNSQTTLTGPTTTSTSAAPNIKVPQRSANPSILRRQNNNNLSHQPVLLPPPSSLPRPAPMMSQPGAGGRNRSLVYNHSSVSLSDAQLSNQSSFNLTSSAPQNDSYVDRYAVFNDIDNLPSIFESTSLGSVNNLNSNNSNKGTMVNPTTTGANSTATVTNAWNEPLNASGSLSTAGTMAMMGSHNPSSSYNQQQQQQQQLNHLYQQQQQQPFQPAFGCTTQVSANKLSQPTMTTVPSQQQSQQFQYQQVPNMSLSISNSNLHMLSSTLNSSANSAIQRPSFQLASANNSFSQSFNHSYLQQSSSGYNSASGQNLASSSLTSTSQTNISKADQSKSNPQTVMFRQTNPFDDDFFA